MCFCSRVPTSPISKLASRQVFTGCGHCEECRTVYKSSWGFRLQSEIESLVNRPDSYKICFFTLTYDDAHLPRLPVEAFREDYLRDVRRCSLASKEWRDYERFRTIPCFSRDDVTRFVHSVREWLWREYDYSDVTYFIASEFGDNTNRPHYHGILAVPPSVDTDKLHSFVLRSWTSKGFVFPRYPSGGYDSQGYKHLPFVVASPSATAHYCAKYVCKDIAYNDYLARSGLDDTILDLSSRAWKRSSCFHVQKRSLGACMLNGLSDASKLDLLRFGKSFMGDSELHKIPVYIKNKLLFDNKYVYEVVSPRFEGSGCYPKMLGNIALCEDYPARRLVRREASRFFKENVREIYKLKISSYASFFRDIGTESNYKGRGFPEKVVKMGVESIRVLTEDFGLTYDEIARDYLLYDGVPRESRLSCSPDFAPYLYLARFASVDTSHCVPILYSKFDDELNLIDFAIKSYFYNPLYRSDFARLTDKVRDYFGHLE